MRCLTGCAAFLLLTTVFSQHAQGQPTSSAIRSVVQQVASGVVVDGDRRPRGSTAERGNSRRADGKGDRSVGGSARGDDGRYDRAETRRNDRRAERVERRGDRYDRYDRDSRYESRSQGKSKKGKGPAFCRNGKGHPVHGRQWCRDKGFGFGYDARLDDRRERRWYERRDEYPVVIFRSEPRPDKN